MATHVTPIPVFYTHKGILVAFLGTCSIDNMFR